MCRVPPLTPSSASLGPETLCYVSEHRSKSKRAFHLAMLTAKSTVIEAHVLISHNPLFSSAISPSLLFLAPQPPIFPRALLFPHQCLRHLCRLYTECLWLILERNDTENSFWTQKVENQGRLEMLAHLWNSLPSSSRTQLYMCSLLLRFC